MKKTLWRAECGDTDTLESGVPLRGQDKLNQKNAQLPGKEILAVPDRSDVMITMEPGLAYVPYSLLRMRVFIRVSYAISPWQKW